MRLQKIAPGGIVAIQQYSRSKFSCVDESVNPFKDRKWPRVKQPVRGMLRSYWNRHTKCAFHLFRASAQAHHFPTCMRCGEWDFNAKIAPNPRADKWRSEKT
jgi:hypothetical protein